MPYKADLVKEIERLMNVKNTVIVAVDGRCGAGKTTLASDLAQAFPCNVFHLDDFYLAMKERQIKMRSAGFVNADTARFERQVLQNVIKGAVFTYQKYLPKDEVFADVFVRPNRLNVVEGAYCTDDRISHYYDLKVFMTAGKDVRIKRLADRGENIKNYLELWIPFEENFFNKQNTQEKADIVIET
jgi:uridine kinase